MGVKVRLSVPPLRILSAFMWRVAEQRQVEYYIRLEEFVSVVLEMMPDLLSAEERLELLLGLRAKFILELCHSQPAVTPHVMQPHLESISRIVECASIDKIGKQTIKTAVKNFVDLILTLLHSPKYRKHFFQDIYPLHYGARYDKALQLLVLQFLCKLEMLMPVPSFRQAACWFDEDPSLLEDSLQMIYDTKEIENVLLHLKGFPHVKPGVLYSPGLANTILSTLSVSFTVKTVLSPFRKDGSCLSTPHAVDKGDGNSDVFEDNKCGDVDKKGTENWSERNNLQSICGEQEALTSFDPELSPRQGSLHEHGSREFYTADESQFGEGCFSKKRPYKHTVHKESADKAIERPHICSYCDKAFRHRGHLTEHIRTHTGERPFSCTVCGRRFAQISNLRKHRQVHTGERRRSNKSEQMIPLLSRDESGASPPPKGDQQDDVNETRNPQKGNQGHTSENGPGVRTEQEVSTSSGEVPKDSSPQDSFLVEGSQSLNSTGDSTGERVQLGCAELVIKSTSLQNNDQDIRPDCGIEDRSERNSLQSICGKQEAPMSLERDPELFLLQDSKREPGSQQFNTADDTEFGKGLLSKTCHSKHQTVCEKSAGKVVKKPHICSYCNKAFRQKCHLTDHIRTHTGEQPFSCTVCGRKFTQSSTLRLHRKVHTGERRRSNKSKQMIPSPSRDESGASQPPKGDGQGDENKIKSASPQNKDQVIRPFNCSVCGKDFRSLSHLKDHTRVHTGERPFACTACELRFRQRSSLVKHIKRKHDDDAELHNAIPRQRRKRIENKKDEKPHICTFCGKGFRHQKRLVRHIRVHTGERPYSCSFCEKRFSLRGNLVTHERLHTGERPFLCSYCGKTYPSSGDLLVHTRYHTGERPYKCEFCGKGFIQSCDLTTHRRVHTKEKPFDCPVCKMKFTAKNKVTRHMRTHTGEKPYECPQCGKRFSRKCHMKDHQLVHK